MAKKVKRFIIIETDEDLVTYHAKVRVGDDGYAKLTRSNGHPWSSKAQGTEAASIQNHGDRYDISLGRTSIEGLDICDVCHLRQLLNIYISANKGKLESPNEVHEIVPT